MKKIVSTIALSAMLSTSLWVAPSFAADLSGGSEGNGESPRAAPTDAYSLRSAKPVEVPKLPAGEEPRAAPMDETTTIKSLTARGHTADGKDITVEASEALRDIVKKELSGGSGDSKASGAQKAEDPAFASDGGERTVFGGDDRVQIKNTKTYPFRAIGYIEMKSPKSGNFGSCSGTLIGPKTVLTAAHCLYNHDDGGWLDEFIFVPGLNGPEDVPYGGYAYETAYVVEGFITNYQGFYGSVVPWDLGIITLKDPIGDHVGWRDVARPLDFLKERGCLAAWDEEAALLSHRGHVHADPTAGTRRRAGIPAAQAVKSAYPCFPGQGGGGDQPSEEREAVHGAPQSLERSLVTNASCDCETHATHRWTYRLPASDA